MTNLLRALCAILLISFSFPVQAQKGGSTGTPPLLEELQALTRDGRHGFQMAMNLLDRSFPQHLHGPDSPADVAALSGRFAAYDPGSDSRVTPGMALFHLGRPLAILRQVGGPRNQGLADLIELRILWRAGQDAEALERAKTLISSQEKAGWSDAEMTSLLADAAVLAWRNGQAEQAAQWFIRARACGTPRCPRDLGFGWLGAKPKPTKEPYAGWDDQIMRQHGEAAVLALLNADRGALTELALEHALWTNGAAGELAQAIELALQKDNPTQLPADIRATLGQLAPRVALRFWFEFYLMSHDSLGAEISGMAGPDLAPDQVDLGEIGYLDADGLYSDTLIQKMPVVALMLRGSDRRGDDVVAEVIAARLLLAKGQADRAVERLLRLLARAEAAGFTGADLFSARMDLWAAARLSGQDRLAAEVWQDAAPCLAALCRDDLVLSFFRRANELPSSRWGRDFDDLTLRVAETMLREMFPDDPLILADLYGAAPSQSHPMDSARHAAISLGYAESAGDIAPADLAKRATSAMDTLVYAGQYAEAAAIGDRIATRLATHAAELPGRFFQVRARAAFRLDDTRAREFYAEAIERHGDSNLGLDLLDTPYLDLLERQLNSVHDPLLKARLRHRQDRSAEAADLLRAERLRILGVDSFAPFNVKELDELHLAFDGMMALAWQEAAYREAAGQAAEAARLRAIGGEASWLARHWTPLPENPNTEAIAAFDDASSFGSNSSYDQIRDIIALRDRGNFEAAAQAMIDKRWVALGAEANGSYTDAQTLWQMAFTFARVGETDIAFDLMNRAARIAATLSFEGAGGADGGTLQLLERDRWRYLLFVDIAWSAMSGQAPEDMLVVSRY